MSARVRLHAVARLISRKKKAFAKNEEGLLWQVKQVSRSVGGASCAKEGCGQLIASSKAPYAMFKKARRRQRHSRRDHTRGDAQQSP